MEKNKKGYDLICLEVDKTTQEKMLKDPKTRKTVQKIFEAIGGLQDKIDASLDNKKKQD